MANRKSAARQALKDMKEAKLNISFFIGNLHKHHSLNISINIDDKPVKQPTKVVERVIVIREVYKIPKPKMYKMNPDGTISIYSDWDRD